MDQRIKRGHLYFLQIGNTSNRQASAFFHTSRPPFSGWLHPRLDLPAAPQKPGAKDYSRSGRTDTISDRGKAKRLAVVLGAGPAGLVDRCSFYGRGVLVWPDQCSGAGKGEHAATYRPDLLYRLPLFYLRGVLAISGIHQRRRGDSQTWP